jgi:hypothetical protein
MKKNVKSTRQEFSIEKQNFSIKQVHYTKKWEYKIHLKKYKILKSVEKQNLA